MQRILAVLLVGHWVLFSGQSYGNEQELTIVLKKKKKKKKNSSHSFFFKRFYLFINEREGLGVETQAEGEAGSTQGAQHGTPSRGSRMRPWAKGDC